MIKIAVCIPSYNEKDNIQNITKLIDKSLDYFDKNYEAIIVNCDNNSPDKTNVLFNKTITKHKKISIVTNEKGKGKNIYNFFKFFIDNKIDYGFTIDSDLKSFELDWIKKMYKKLNEGNNFVFPLYKRRKEEGNTTNHFVVPLLYSVYGKFVRQPIGGDFGFDSKFVYTIMKEQFTENIMKYGIDIFLTITALANNFKISNVYLGEKIHSASYNKMENIFEDVLKGFTESYLHYNKNFSKEKIDYVPFTYKIEKSEFRDLLENKYQYCLNECNLNQDYNEILNYWASLLKKYKKEINNPSPDLIKKMKFAFICRSISFWDEMNIKKEKEWEKELIKFCYLLEEKL
ncbi:MAG: glycosyltransferase [Firmicutes bacterium]|nr:glycosyltransferase [Bacillota bacterium]